MSKERTFLKGALTLSIGGLIAKILGALYRIPLTNIIGSYGMGLYQLVFPPYILMLTLAQAGVPVALSKLIAESNARGCSNDGKKLFKLSSVFLITAGAIGMLIFLIFAPQIATLQGNADTTTAFRIVAPAIFFVAATGAFKGYFQGNVNMVPSSATLVIEQIIKLVIGLACALYFMPDTLRAVSGAVLGITISEMLSFIIMVCVYLVENKGKIRLPLATTVERKECYSKIFALAIPIALGGFIMQLTQFVDSVMVVNLLGGVGATSLYGLWTGPVNSMLGLPIALSSGVAISTLPSITQTYTKRDDVQLRKNFNTAIKLTLVIALPSAFGMILMSDSIIGMLYKGLPAEEIAISAKLLSISGISIVFLSVAQTSISILQAVGKPYVSVLTLFGAVVVKAVANLILLPIDSINIYGAGISETLCFAFVAISDIIYLNKKLKMKLDSEVITKPLAACLCMTLALVAINALFVNVSRSTIGALIEITVAVVVYFAVALLLKIFDRKELGLSVKS